MSFLLTILCSLMLILNFDYLSLLLSYKSSLYILDTNPLLAMWLASIFTHTVDCHRLPVIWLESTIVLNSDEVPFTSCLVACAYGVLSKKLLPKSKSWIFTPMFCSKRFVVLALTFRFMIHFELMFECDMKYSFSFNP